MKTTIIAFVIFVSISVMNTFAANGSKIYRTTIADKETNSLTITVCEGKNDINLIPLRKYTIKYDETGLPIEKILYTWNNTSGWIADKKYAYGYNDNGFLEVQSYTTWNKQTNDWIDNVMYTMYVYDSENTIFDISNYNIIAIK